MIQKGKITSDLARGGGENIKRGTDEITTIKAVISRIILRRP